jgi:malate dehydrogenase
MKKVRVVVTGAAGQIGYALVFRIASGQMFGPDVDVELNLLELTNSLPILEGVAMELNDCAFKNLKRIKCTDNLNEAMDGVNYALLVGSVPRKQGMERSDLLNINGGVFKAQGSALNAKAAQDVKILVVGNPCNTNCLIAKHHAKDIPGDRFYAMSLLDELRARYQLANKASVDITAISKMIIWGNHSATQYPDFHNALINGKSAFDVINDEAWFKDVFVPTVQQRGAAVIKARGASSAASAANAALTSIWHLVNDTQEGETFSICRTSHGEYGVDEGLIFSFPSVRKNGVDSIVEGFKFNDYGQKAFNNSLEELRSEYAAVKGLGLLD